MNPASPVHVYALRHEYLTNPIGTHEPKPRLSWRLKPSDAATQRGLEQSAYQILVASTRDGLEAGKPDLWDSGKIASKQTTFVEYAGKTLQSGQRAWWTVRVWDQSGAPCAVPAAQFWETGLLTRSEWVGKWIGSEVVGAPTAMAPAPYLRKSFTLPAGRSIVSARLYATALGLYEFYLNGQRVGEDVFAPFCTDYRKRVQYQAYDVTHLLGARGENVAGAVLGDGWYAGYMGFHFRRQFYGDRPRLLAQIVVRLDDGSTHTIATDESWSVSTGPILWSDFQMGEHYDARAEMPGWNAPGFKPGQSWQPVRVFDDPGIEIVAMQGPPVRAIQEIKPINLTRKHGMTLLDLGQNMVGRVRIRAKGVAGETMRLRFVEILDDKGNPYTTNLRAAQQTDTYVFKGDPNGETWESRFTFHGFRYIAIDGNAGVAAQPTTPITLDTVTGIVLHTQMEPTGKFECSDPLVNQLQSNIQWGQRGNFVDIPTDCPQRDERLGWTGDAQVFCRTATFNFDVSGFFAKWTQDLRDSQSPERGSFPSFVPNVSAGRSGSNDDDGGPAWSDAGIICPWTVWQVYGDARLIERHYESLKKFVDGMQREAEPFKLIRSHPEFKAFHGFGDWLATDAYSGILGATPMDLIGTAYLAYDAQLLSQIAKALGKTQDAEHYAKLAADTARAFRKRFVSEEGLIVGNTQTAYALALHFNLLLPEHKPAAIDALVRNIRKFETRLNTGFVGSSYLNPVLSANGQHALACELLMQKRWPSWLYAVTQGATTIWERWDGWTADKGFADPGMNSFNHYAYGAVGAWLYQTVAGLDLDPARPGYEHILLNPHPAGPLTHASASLETIRGQARSGWRKSEDGKTCDYTFVIPPGAEATLRLLTPSVASVRESGKPVTQADGVTVVSQDAESVVLKLKSGTYQFSAGI